LDDGSITRPFSQASSGGLRLRLIRRALLVCVNELKYIAKSKLGWDHTPYWDYLESVKRLMPANMHAFASNSENHDLTSPNSLHDSWLEYWKVSEIPTAERGDRATQIDVCLLTRP
jgi:hypothetical protein